MDPPSNMNDGFDICRPNRAGSSRWSNRASGDDAITDLLSSWQVIASLMSASVGRGMPVAAMSMEQV